MKKEKDSSQEEEILEQNETPSEKESSSLNEEPLESEEKNSEDLLSKKLLEYEELIKRQASDFNNFRKRTQSEKEEMHFFVSSKVIEQFLPILDNLERAFEASKQSEDVQALRTGLEGILHQFQSVLTQYEVLPVDSMNQEFDPSVHEALFKNEGDYEKQVVIQEIEKAYSRKDKLIRTAKVGVGVPKA